MVSVKKNSKYRPARKTELKSVSVNTDVHRKLISEKVISAIEGKWPGPKYDLSVMQKDKVPCHLSIDDVDGAEEGQTFRWNIKTTNQPANF